jgi:hypothetical protein
MQHVYSPKSLPMLGAAHLGPLSFDSHLRLQCYRFGVLETNMFSALHDTSKQKNCKLKIKIVLKAC